MPLSKDGKKILSKMIGEYGAKKGKQVFYASENSKPKFAAIVRKHKK